MVANQYI